MATNTKNNRVQLLAAERKLIAGTNQFLSLVGALPVGSQTVTPAQIVQVIEDRIAKGEAVVAATDARTAAVKADRDERAKTAPFVNAFKRIVIGMFLQSPDTLGAFGLHAPKLAKKTVATKASATQKMAATKKARGPIGKKQRAKVKAPAPAAGTSQPTPGATTAATPAPTAPPAAAPAPSPAPSGGATTTAPAARPGA